MLGEVSLQRQLELGDLGPQASFGQVGELVRVLLTTDQGPEHGSPRLAQDVGGHGAQLDVGIFQDLVDAVGQRTSARRPTGRETASGPATRAVRAAARNCLASSPHCNS